MARMARMAMFQTWNKIYPCESWDFHQKPIELIDPIKVRLKSQNCDVGGQLLNSVFRFELFFRPDEEGIDIWTALSPSNKNSITSSVFAPTLSPPGPWNTSLTHTFECDDHFHRKLDLSVLVMKI